jgi:uncharacterized protein (DUF488 family)
MISTPLLREEMPRDDHSPDMIEQRDTTIWTIGHSTRSSDELIAVLEAHGIELIADVRRMPGSRRLPQFDSAVLEHSLAEHGIAYRWIQALGGRRRLTGESAPTGWRHAAFHAYAVHVGSEEFAEGLFELLMLAGGMRTAVMCAEVLWWRCHRRLIADVLVSLDIPVMHIATERPAEPHHLAPPARLDARGLTYAPAEELELLMYRPSSQR